MIASIRDSASTMQWLGLRELDHTTYIFSGEHISIRLIDLIERIRACNQLVQLELARIVHLEQIRNVAQWLRVAVECTHDRLLVQNKIKRGHRNRLGGEGGQANDDGGAVFAGAGVSHANGGRSSDSLEGIVRAQAPGQFFDGLYHILLLRNDGVCGPKLFGTFELVVHFINGDNHTRTSDSCTLHGVHADATTADDYDRTPRHNSGTMNDRPHTGRHTTTNQYRLIERVMLHHLHHLDVRHNGTLAEG